VTDEHYPAIFLPWSRTFMCHCGKSWPCRDDRTGLPEDRPLTYFESA